MLFLFCSEVHRKVFVDSMKWNTQFMVVKENFQVYEHIYATCVQSHITFKYLEQLNFQGDVFIISDQCKIKELRPKWYMCRSADEIEAFAEIPLDKHVKHRITYSIYSAPEPVDNNVNHFIQQLSVPDHHHEENCVIETVPAATTIKRIRVDQCQICIDNLANIMFDCGHQVICGLCFKIWNSTCPVCRKKPKILFEDDGKK
jgi:hypothetical protein